MKLREFNFDGLVGPTHNYAGLSYGNVASTSHRNLQSNPREAALQGLAKMRTLAGMGIGQAILPPLPRPRIRVLRELGFEGSRQKIISQVAESDPILLASVYSASNMWTANAATISPSLDCQDGRLHLSVANLSSGLHRSIEASGTCNVLSAIFSDEEVFCVHKPLPGASALSDEGAANHTRLYAAPDKPGIEVFVFGRSAMDVSRPAPQKFPARQTLEASQSVARRHGLDPDSVVFIQQNPAAIDAGVFHNDVISVGNQNVLLCHEWAFENQQASIDSIQHAFRERCGAELIVFEVKDSDLSISDCVASYLFNSQLITCPDGSMKMICPTECREVESAYQVVQAIVESVDPIAEVVFMDLRQSMNNGGGPACLRLRVAMTEEQIARMHQGVIWTPELDRALQKWIRQHYRENLCPDDLKDPRLAIEMDAAFVALADILQLPLLEFTQPEK